MIQKLFGKKKKKKKKFSIKAASFHFYRFFPLSFVIPFFFGPPFKQLNFKGMGNPSLDTKPKGNKQGDEFKKKMKTIKHREYTREI